MPLYDYDCAACGRRFEVIHGVFAEPPTACALCGSGPVRKAFAAPAVHFKGTGWAKKERRSATSKSGGTAKDDDGGAKGGDGTTPATSTEGGSSSGGSTTPPATSTTAPVASGD